ncbi:MAG: DUF2339 domain-containing protein [Rhodothermales bacterium]
MRWILMLLGAFAGAAILDEEGILLGAFLGYLLHDQLDLRRRLKEVEQRLAGRLEVPVAERPATERLDAPPPIPAAVETPEPVEVVQSSDEPAPVFVPFDPEPAPDAPPRVRKPTILDEGIAAARRFLFGGNVIVRAGVIVLFFALSFLVKLAIDNDVFPIELRLAAVAAVGIGLIGAGWRFKALRRGYGLSLQGGGLAVLYLTIYTAFKVYGLIDPGIALLLLLVTALLGAAIAILEDSEGLAVIGFLGGFLAPVLASTGSGDHVMLFGFYAVLNAGLFAIAWFKPWRWLNRVGFYSTFGIGAVWGGLSYRPELFASTEPFLIGFFLCYFALSILYATRQRREGRPPIDGTLVFALPVVAFTLQSALVESIPYGLAWSSLILGGFYTVAAWLVYQRAPELLRLMVESFAAIALGLLTMTLPFALDASWTGAGWALEGAALVWLGCRQNQLRLRIFGVLLQLAAGLFLFQALDELSYDQRHALLSVLNPMVTGFASLSAAAFFTAFQIHRRSDRSATWERTLEPLFLAIGVAWLAGGGLFEITRLFSNKPAIDAGVAFLALSSLALFAVGARLSWRGMRLAALYPLPLYYLAFLPLLFADHPLKGYGLAVWAVAFAIEYLVLHRTERDQPAWLTRAYHAGALWHLLLVVTWSCGMWMENLSGSGRSAWTLLGLMLPTLAAALLALRGLRAGWWPFAPHRRTYLLFALGLPLLALWIGSILSIGREAAASPLPYVPLLNPLDLVLGFTVVAAIAWYREARADISLLAGPDVRRGLIWVLAFTIFLWLNATIARTVHFWAGVSYDPDTLAASGLFQTALSICWTLIAVTAMAWAHRSRNRAVWFASGALLALVVVKLFVVDLSSLTMMMKVISFMVVGVLLLIIGYIAPVPPARDDDAGSATAPDTPPLPVQPNDSI